MYLLYNVYIYLNTMHIFINYLITQYIHSFIYHIHHIFSPAIVISSRAYRLLFILIFTFIKFVHNMHNFYQFYVQRTQYFNLWVYVVRQHALILYI